MCSICKSRGKEYGACVQCYFGKCVRAFHVTCAANEGVRLFDEQGNPHLLWYTYNF